MHTIGQWQSEYLGSLIEAQGSVEIETVIFRLLLLPLYFLCNSIRVCHVTKSSCEFFCVKFTEEAILFRLSGLGC